MFVLGFGGVCLLSGTHWVEAQETGINSNKAGCAVVAGFCAIQAPFCQPGVSQANFYKLNNDICLDSYKDTKSANRAIAKRAWTNLAGQKLNVVITAYSSTIQETDDTPFLTANGSYVRDGIVANNLLPFGTKVKIPAIYGDKVFSVEDRMHQRLGGDHFDIWFPSQSQAREFGVKYTYVEVLNE